MIMSTDYGFVAKKVYPSEEGIWFEYYTENEAMNAYAQAKSVGANVEMDSPLTMLWKIKNTKKTFENKHPT
jgi:hypothetical protein